MIGVPREIDPDRSTLRMETSVATLTGTDTESMTTGTIKGIHRTVITKERTLPTIPRTPTVNRTRNRNVVIVSGPIMPRTSAKHVSIVIE